MSSILVSGTLQTLLGRPGPPPRTVLEPETNGSFRSVSAEEVVLQAALIAYLARQFLPNRRYPILGLVIVSVGLMAFVLINSAVHWPSDVLGGLSFGAAWTTSAVILGKRWKWLQGPRI